MSDDQTLGGNQPPDEQRHDQAEDDVQLRTSRRDFFKKVGLVAGGMAAGGSLGFATSELISDREPVEPVEDVDGVVVPTAVQGTLTPTPPFQEAQPREFEEAFTFFRIDEAAVVEAMAERIYPADGLGPGATDAGVVYYLDRQLSSGWGFGAHWYMQEPFDEDEAADTQGWQYPLVPRDFYRASIEFIQEYCFQNYGEGFSDLPASEQDEVIQALEDGEIETFRGIDPDDFFEVVRTGTLEGLYADPLWGGNRDMAGWWLKRYPGSRISYRDQVASKDFIEMDPQRLAQGHGGVRAPHHHGQDEQD
ncbi:hypothetical protein BH23CHL2_BH23CHL2_20050 [soil metagenome]